MKKMLKRLGVVIPSTILTLLMAVGFSTPAFAFVDTTEVTEEPVQVIEEAEPTEEEKIPFTIAGNGEVEDNIVDDPSKEFFTVKTKDGNTFFLVIDRARNSENVYMLSMIDEYDLQEFLDDEDRNGKQEEETPAVVLPETKPEPTPDVEIEEPKEESSGGMNKILLLVFVAALGGAGAFFYFYIYKPKPKEETPQSENAESLHISTNWFIHNFKQYAGMSPAQYILSLRMVNAQSLLERTTYNIKEISEIVGYENPLYFSRVFKKEIGKSPAQYRKERATEETV